MRLWPSRPKTDRPWGPAVSLDAGQTYVVFDPRITSVHIQNTRPSSIRVKMEGGRLYLHIEDEVKPPA